MAYGLKACSCHPLRKVFKAEEYSMFEGSFPFSLYSISELQISENNNSCPCMSYDLVSDLQFSVIEFNYFVSNDQRMIHLLDTECIL